MLANEPRKFSCSGGYFCSFPVTPKLRWYWIPSYHLQFLALGLIKKVTSHKGEDHAAQSSQVREAGGLDDDVDFGVRGSCEWEGCEVVRLVGIEGIGGNNSA